MSNVWDRFEGIATPDEIKVAKDKFKPLDPGRYKMVLVSIEAGENKSGLPKVGGKLKTVEGAKLQFYNQNLQNVSNPDMTAVNIAEAVTFVGGLLGEDLEFTTLGQFAQDIERCNQDCQGSVYTIDVSYGKNDGEMKFPKFKIVPEEAGDVYAGLAGGEGEDEIPF